MRRFFAGLVLLTAACTQSESPAPVIDEDTRLTLEQGEIVGFTTGSGAYSWRGVPYAQAPVGDLRWRAPRPAAPWSGAREALTFAPRCTQMSSELNQSEGIEPGIILGSEDCLFLDIYAPPDAAGKDLPVMVWIHGGANVWGRGTSYEGSNLALNENVIVISVQYRLGPLGYFAHPFLRDSAETPEDRAANFATLDLIEALRWVRANIPAFGGDADNVTIFGESAGGHNVAALLGSPLAAGLFEQAILQSGSFDSLSLEQAETTGGIENASDTIIARLGAESADDLRAFSTEELFDAYIIENGAFFEMPLVIEDGVVLPDTPLRDAFASVETFNAVPIITGTNRDELKLFNFLRDDLVKRRFFIFPVARDPEFYNILSDYMARIWRIRAVDDPAAMMATAGHTNVYGYRFDWDDAGRFLLTDFKILLGAGHAVEIPFVFNRFSFFGERFDKIIYNEKTETEREDLSRAMGSYWASFARTGTPQAPDNPQWPEWASDGGTILLFDASTDRGIRTLADIDSLPRLIADLRADDRLSEKQKCQIVTETSMWNGEIASLMRAGNICPLID